jgi:uncharacterized protein YoxC
MSNESFTVRGFSAEARNAVKICARKAKKTQGKWLEEVVLQAAKDMMGKKTEVARPEDVFDIIKKMSDDLEAVKKMSNKVDELSNRLNKPWWKKIID